MPRERIVHDYQFNELSEEAKEKAIENLRNINVDYDDWYDYLVEDLERRLEQKGYSDVKSYFSGFWSQGDGASFEASVDVVTWLTATGLKSDYPEAYRAAEEDDLRYKITQSGMYYHENTMRIEINSYSDYGVDLDVLGDAILEDARDEARQYYKDLEVAYEDATSDENVIETIEANDYEFDEDGTRA